MGEFVLILMNSRLMRNLGSLVVSFVVSIPTTLPGDTTMEIV